MDEDTYRNYKERLNKVLGHTNAVVEKTKAWFETNKEDWKACEKCYVIGYGANVGTAMEGALKSMKRSISLFLV